MEVKNIRDNPVQELPNCQALRTALIENRFCLYFQPIVPLLKGDNGHVHKEVLVRMVGEDGKIIPPKHFLPCAEESGLMPSIDRWVLESFFHGMYHPSKCMGCWARDYYCGCIIAFNLSGSSVNNDSFLDFLENAIKNHPVPPSSLVFEITETVALINLDKTQKFIERLQNLGCQFALDDFGTGMSSLAYLKELPLNFVKIDGMFVHDIVENRLSEAIVSAIVQMAKAKKIKTIAEYVENVKILERLQELGVDYAQGFYLGKPAPILKQMPIF